VGDHLVCSPCGVLALIPSEGSALRLGAGPEVLLSLLPAHADISVVHEALHYSVLLLFQAGVVLFFLAGSRRGR
jgi:hypothetical protein